MSTGEVNHFLKKRLSFVEKGIRKGLTLPFKRERIIEESKEIKF